MSSEKNEHLLALLQQQKCQQLEQVVECSFTPVLKQIIANAEKNASRLPVGRRHPEILFKSFLPWLKYQCHQEWSNSQLYGFDLHPPLLPLVFSHS